MMGEFDPDDYASEADYRAGRRRQIAEVHKISEAAKARPDEARAGVDPEIARLAALDPLAYDRCRIGEAGRLGVRVSTLDAAVEKARNPEAEDVGQGGTLDIADVEPWPHPVDGALLLTDLAETFARYAVLPPHAEIILALWIVMTYLYDAISVAPVLAITSPEKGCGKTTVLEIISPRAPCAIREQHLVGGAIPQHREVGADAINRRGRLIRHKERRVARGPELRPYPADRIRRSLYRRRL